MSFHLLLHDDRPVTAAWVVVVARLLLSSATADLSMPCNARRSKWQGPAPYLCAGGLHPPAATAAMLQRRPRAMHINHQRPPRIMHAARPLAPCSFCTGARASSRSFGCSSVHTNEQLLRYLPMHVYLCYGWICTVAAVPRGPRQPPRRMYVRRRMAPTLHAHLYGAELPPYIECRRGGVLRTCSLSVAPQSMLHDREQPADHHGLTGARHASPPSSISTCNVCDVMRCDATCTACYYIPFTAVY
jgi:hypothetical protein